MNRIVQIFCVFLVLLVAAGGAVLLIKFRRKPQRFQPEVRPPLVEVVKAARDDHPVVVAATGVVVPNSDVTIQPQVSGLIIEKNPNLGTGGRLKKGDMLLRIDPRDYQLAVEQRKADLERAKYELAIEEGRQVVARREWDLLGKEVERDDAGRSLALREPQLRNAKAGVKSAEAALEQARINLERTTLTVPFDSLVVTDYSEIGQLVSPGAPIARLIGTDQFKVRMSLPVEKLSLIRIGGVDGVPEGEGASVKVIQVADQRGRIVREGRTTRLQADLDPVGRLARLQAVVKDPLRLDSRGGLPLLVDAYVRCEIEGNVLKDVIALPRDALREGDVLWLVRTEEDGTRRLEIRRDVTIALKGRDKIYVSGGLEEGERVVVGRVAVPSDGRKVRLEGDAPKAEAQPQPAEPPMKEAAQ